MRSVQISVVHTWLLPKVFPIIIFGIIPSKTKVIEKFFEVAIESWPDYWILPPKLCIKWTK